jgi:ribonucleoside-diphosphate reductase alpha chain
MGGRYVPSLLAAIGEVIERHMINIGFLASPGRLADPERESAVQVVKVAVGDEHQGVSDDRFRWCPKCSSPTLIHQENCDTCTSCGYSKCS